MNTPIILMILDGWGYSQDQEYNAIAQAQTPNWDHLWQNYPHTLINCSGTVVGLPNGQMGNSEVGHMHMGAGRLVAQDLLRIDQAIENHTFADNPTLQQGLTSAKQHALHIFGLLSPGGVHSSEQHIFKLIEIATQTGVDKIYCHAFLDGRDTPPKSALASLQKVEELLKEHPQAKIASIVGRYYAMDRDKRWERTELAYRLVCQGQAEHQSRDAAQALADAYARGETDEFVKPTVIGEPVAIQDRDTIIFMNFRADRARQLTQVFIDNDFNKFERAAHPNTQFLTLTKYANYLPTQALFPYHPPQNCLGEYLSQQGLQQLRIAETEKYAHVTFFFNGGIEEPFPGEDRLLIPSPKVATYDLQPEMSALEVTEALIKAMAKKHYDLIILNFANADMVGHSGNFQATLKAVECIDSCIEKVTTACQAHGGEILITADHGNAESMFNPKTQQAHTAHTHNPVPLLYIGRKAQFTGPGSLQDIAPTILHLMGLTPPAEMIGKNLIEIDK